MENLSKNGNACTTNHPLRSISIPPCPLSDVERILQDEMEPMFRELKVDIAACPCLAREPFNLAGVGLCGNTSLIEIGGYMTFMPFPRFSTAKWDIQKLLSHFCYDSFIIGAGYAVKPYMPYNGHLIMNAMYRAPANITNASRIVFAESNGQRRIETLTEPSQMVCSFIGNFFSSEGKQGNVIRLRAKGRRSRYSDITAMMHKILYEELYIKRNRFVALGGVLKIKNGRVVQNVMPEQYPPRISSFNDIARSFQCHDMDLESDLIAVGTIVNSLPDPFTTEQRYGFYLSSRRHNFHSFSNYGAGGQFISDITKDVTEYEGYFNLASKIYTLECCS